MGGHPGELAQLPAPRAWDRLPPARCHTKGRASLGPVFYSTTWISGFNATVLFKPTPLPVDGRGGLGETLLLVKKKTSPRNVAPLLGYYTLWKVWMGKPPSD